MLKTAGTHAAPTAACARLRSAPRAPTAAAAARGATLGKFSRVPARRAAPAARGSCSALGQRVMAGDADGEKVGVLFVCLGNICRSPTAEAMFTAVVKKAGLSDAFDIDSCGTGGGNPSWYMEGGWSYHEGEDADPRMTEAAKKRGVYLTSKSRPLKPEDFTRFKYIVGMDANNRNAIVRAAEHWSSQGSDVPAEFMDQLSTMTSYCTKNTGATEVPDPYYGGPSGFEKVLDLLEDACTGLLDDIKEDNSLKK